MESYIGDTGAVNAEVDAVELEIPAFLPRRPAQAASSKPRRRISPAVWSTVRAHLAREYSGLLADSPRRKPSLPRLRCLERPEHGGALLSAGSCSEARRC